VFPLWIDPYGRELPGSADRQNPVNALKGSRQGADDRRMGLRIGIPLFAAAFVADLVSKTVAVNGHWAVYFHDVPSRLPKRLLMIALAVAATVALTKLSARRRDFGRPWGAWVGVPILTAGILGNGISPYFWHGVPDFIWTGNSIMNVADFEILFGIVGGTIVLVLGYCVTYGREALTR
jgi:hypothetical protein